MNLFLEKRNLILLLLLIYCNLNALSQSKPDSVRQLREVTVTEDYRHAKLRSTTPWQIFDSKTLRSLNSLQVSDAVKYFSGVTVKDYGGIGGLKTVSVRSLGANHTVISYDGIAFTDMQTGQIDIGRFSLENVEMISLSNGQSDNIFQPARLFASASVLNIKTLTPQFTDNKPVNGKIALKGGSFGLLNPSLLLNGKINKKLSAAFSGEWLSANGKYPYTLHYGPSASDSVSIEIRQNTDVKNIRLEGTMFADFSEKSKGYVKTYFYNSERGLPGAIVFYNHKSFSSQRLWDNTFFTQAHYENNFSKTWSIQANAKYNLGRITYVDKAWLNNAERLENQYRQHELYGSFAALCRITDKFSFSTSSDITLNRLQANLPNFAYPSRFLWLTSLAGKYVNHRFTAIGSLLYTQTAESVQNGIPADNQKKISPFISFSAKPFEEMDVRVRGFYKNTFRLPTFNDLYYVRVGERKLKPEDAHLLNLGLTYTFSVKEWLSFLTFTADAYHNSIQNKIVAKPSSNLFEWTMSNYGMVHVNGLDASLHALFSIYQDISLEVGNNYMFQKAVDATDPTSRTFGHQLPYTPFHSASGRVSLLTPWLDIAYTWIWSGVRYSNYQNYTENRLPAYVDHGISFHKSFMISGVKISSDFEALNIFNQTYQVIRDFPMPGRAFRATFSLNY